MTDHESLIQFATVRQIEVLDALREHGTQEKAAVALGITTRNVAYALARLRKSAGHHGISLKHGWVHGTPQTHTAEGVSTYYEKTESSPAQWVKAKMKQEAYNEAVREAIAGFMEDITPLAVSAGPVDVQTDIIPWIQIGDGHLGMLAHLNETTQNFDLKIAERELCTAIDMLIDEMPMCERIVINDLGDMTHYSNMKGETAMSGNKLDYDGRFPKMIRVYSSTMRHIVEKVLTKAKTVDVIINKGNHSEENDVWMAELLRVAYGPSGRVNVLDNSSAFIGYRMGKTLVMTTHGHTCKPNNLVGVLTSDFAKDYGETEFRYIDVGHVHHHYVSKEYPGTVVESWNNLPPNDKWAHDSGYRSRKSISVVLRSRKYGDVGRRVLPIQQIRDRLASVGTRSPEIRTGAYKV